MITYEAKGLQKLTTLGEKYPAIAEKHINQAIFNSLVRIRSGQKSEAPFGVTGQLRDRWDIATQRFAGSLKSLVRYGGSIENGTRPHAVSAKVLMDWAAKRGLNPYAVAKSIAKKGTRANPFMKRTLDTVGSGIDNEFSKAIDNVLEDLKNQIT